MTARYRARVSGQGHHLRRNVGTPTPVGPNLVSSGAEPAPRLPEPLRSLNTVPDTRPRAAEARPNIWLVVPCKGRLSFLQQTVNRLLAHPNAKLCLVDYSCPDHAGDWFEQQFAHAITEGRACVERVPGQSFFSKTRAHNAGARRALSEGAEYLCFLDADTLVEPGFWEHLFAEARPNRFLVAGKERDGCDVPSMTGLLLVHGKPFTNIQGFDEHFQGWGGEDIELRLRLYMVAGLDFAFVPVSLARPIPHDDSLRSQFYAVRNITISNRENMDRLRYRMTHEWLPQSHRDPAGAAPLWYRPPATSQYAPRRIRLTTSEASTSLSVGAQSGRRVSSRRGGE